MIRNYLLFTVITIISLSTGCSSLNPTDDIHNHVRLADRNWAAYCARQVPKPFTAGRVALERRMYEKAQAKRGQTPEWAIREAGWKYVIAVNTAMTPDAPLPPGKFSVANHPFREGTTLK